MNLLEKCRLLWFKCGLIESGGDGLGVWWADSRSSFASHVSHYNERIRQAPHYPYSAINLTSSSNLDQPDYYESGMIGLNADGLLVRLYRFNLGKLGLQSEQSFQKREYPL